MALRSRVSLILLATAAFFTAGCTPTPRRLSAQQQRVRPGLTAASSPATAVSVQRQLAAPPPSNAPLVAPPPEAAAAPAGAPRLEDAEERRGPFLVAGQTFTVLLHYKRLPGETGPDSQTLASLEILDAAGDVQHRE